MPSAGAIKTSTGALRIGGDSIWGEYFSGLIDEVRIYNRALSAAEIQTDMNTAVGGVPPPPDTTPPTVSMTAPAAGATLSGTVALTANASDNVGVVGVQFFVNGTAVGSEVTAAPYTVNWDSTTVANGGPYNITARARRRRQPDHQRGGFGIRQQYYPPARIRPGGCLRFQ